MKPKKKKPLTIAEAIGENPGPLRINNLSNQRTMFRNAANWIVHGDFTTAYRILYAGPSESEAVRALLGEQGKVN